VVPALGARGVSVPRLMSSRPGWQEEKHSKRKNTMVHVGMGGVGRLTLERIKPREWHGGSWTGCKGWVLVGRCRSTAALLACALGGGDLPCSLLQWSRCCRVNWSLDSLPELAAHS